MGVHARPVAFGTGTGTFAMDAFPARHKFRRFGDGPQPILERLDDVAEASDFAGLRLAGVWNRRN
jgi:hypothetical protein